MEQYEGLIVKATGGFYYVKAGEAVYECRARGLFRKQGISPCCGDRVMVDPTGAQTGYLSEILPRKNMLVRPPLANLDRLAVVCSVSDPAPNLLVIDKMIAVACHKGITPMLLVTKQDLGSAERLREIYTPAGVEVFVFSAAHDEGLTPLRAALSEGITAFTGNTGVGKSSLLNRLDSRLTLETGETSKKLGRGRHTTRHVELFEVGESGYIADTPGFSSLDLERYAYIRKEELAECFVEFAPHLEKCKFTGCSHTVEKGCAVLAALAAGEFAKSRHENYCALYEDAKKIREWEMKDR